MKKKDMKNPVQTLVGKTLHLYTYAICDDDGRMREIPSLFSDREHCLHGAYDSYLHTWQNLANDGLLNQFDGTHVDADGNPCMDREAFAACFQIQNGGCACICLDDDSAFEFYIRKKSVVITENMLLDIE